MNSRLLKLGGGVRTLTERELLERALAFWERIANAGAASEPLRQELIDLLYAYRAQGLVDGARLLHKARRSCSRDGIDPVSRYLLCQVEEELQRRASGHPPSDDVLQWSSSITPN